MIFYLVLTYLCSFHHSILQFVSPKRSHNFHLFFISLKLPFCPGTISLPIDKSHILFYYHPIKPNITTYIVIFNFFLPTFNLHLFNLSNFALPQHFTTTMCYKSGNLVPKCGSFITYWSFTSPKRTLLITKRKKKNFKNLKNAKPQKHKFPKKKPHPTHPS